MTALSRDYDAWRLAGLEDRPNAIGTEPGDNCGRYPESDEDVPRNWRPRPCGGLMVLNRHGEVVCESCGAEA